MKTILIIWFALAQPFGMPQKPFFLKAKYPTEAECQAAAVKWQKLPEKPIVQCTKN